MNPTADESSLSAREIADRYLTATRGGSDADQSTFDRLISDDVTWELCGSGVEYARVYRGKAEVYGEFLGRLQRHVDAEKSVITTRDVFVDEEQRAIIVHNEDALVLTNGARVDNHVVMIMRVEAGQISSVLEVMDLRPVVAAFGPTLG